MTEDKHCEASTDKRQDDKEPVKQVHLYIPLSLHEQLKKLAKNDCLPTTTYIRKALNHHVNKK
ncbi:hypothetical protein OCB02_08725 [Bacillus cereus]|uniref:hypothetical protein n=1 Tax=Bacillus cereus TaxID=1396 RepID=UPI001E54EE6F|nr:hypothetical protein [Bacillus cereus]MCU5475826.1 hypothetical protein [Bacillus cereus]MCU5613149.1 hypothetical protein [Bacillus cereus]